MFPVGAIFVPFPPKTGTKMLHPRPPAIVELVFPCSANHDQDWQPYPVDPHSAYYICDDHILYMLYDVLEKIAFQVTM